MTYQLKPIANKLEHDEALAQFEARLAAPDGSSEAYEREVLAILIEKYEEETISIPLPNPIEAIKFRMEQSGLTRKDLEPILGSRSKVSEILSGKRELTLQMARGLHTQLGIPAESLLGTAPVNNMTEVDFDRFPVAEMEKNGAFRLVGIENAKDTPERALRALVDLIGGPKAIPAGLLRKTTSTRLNAKLNRYALSGWCFQVLAEASQIKAAPYQKGSLTDEFLQSLVRLSVKKEGPKLAQERLRERGVLLVIVPHLKNTYLDGAAFMTPKGRPVIGMTLRYDKVDNFWFALFHELGHLVCHLENDPGSYLADDLSLRGAQNESDQESEADKFAERHLFPDDFDEGNFISTFDVLSYASEHGIAPALIAGRIQYSRQNYRLFANLLGRNEVGQAFRDPGL